MGLDQYAYIANKQGARDEWWEGAEMNKETNDFENPNMSKPQELAYWRKHPNLQGWMEKLWTQKLLKEGKTPEESQWGSSFNGVELELTWDDIDMLEKDLKRNKLKKLQTRGFFFGDPSDNYYKDYDLKFCTEAKAELFLGRKVLYNSSW